MTAKADKSITPDQPQASEQQRAGQQYAPIARRACRTEVESKAARVGWVEEQAFHLEKQLDVPARARKTSGAGECAPH